MKKLMVLFVSFLIASGAYAVQENLYETLKDKPHIKVYLKEVKNDTKDPHVKLDVFKNVFKEVMTKRINIKFIPVNNAKDADVVVTAEIKEYVFEENVLPSFFGGTAAIVADATAPKSSARLVVDYTVTDPKNGDSMLEHKKFTTEARRPVKDMQGEKAFIYATQKNANRFLYRSFHRQRPKRSL